MCIYIYVIILKCWQTSHDILFKSQMAFTFMHVISKKSSILIYFKEISWRKVRYCYKKIPWGRKLVGGLGLIQAPYDQSQYKQVYPRCLCSWIQNLGKGFYFWILFLNIYLIIIRWFKLINFFKLIMCVVLQHGLSTCQPNLEGIK